jgi:hypothetical protein
MATILASDNLEIAFGDNPLRIERIRHSASGRVLCEGSDQLLTIRLPREPSDPIFLREIGDVDATQNSLRFEARDHAGRFKITATVEAGVGGLQFCLAASGTEPILMVEWKIEGLALKKVIVPALGGQALTSSMPPEVQLTYKYPFWWNAQFVLAEVTEDPEAGGIWLRTEEVAPRFKLFRVHKTEEKPGQFSLGLGFEANAPVEACELEASWTFDGYPRGWRQPVEQHRKWLQKAFELVSYRDHPHMPAWANDINFVLEFWGMRKDRGLPAHTFDEIVERLQAFADKHPPSETLVYLPGYAEGGIDSRIPDYRPSQDLGGDAGLRRLVDAAHGLGYRVMIHTNVLGMTYTHPRFPAFAEHQVVDQFGQRLGWGNDLDGDWLPEPYFAYINPGADAWGELMEKRLGDLINEFGLDGVFLDQTLLAFNVSQGPNFIEGMRKHIRRLQRSYPDVLFGGEGQHEQVLPELPFVQIHGIDSLTEIHGMEGAKPWRLVHPVSTTLFGPHTRFFAHLLTKHPSSPGFARQEEAYAELGVIPALVCYRRSHAIAGPSVDALLARARDFNGPASPTHPEG